METGSEPRDPAREVLQEAADPAAASTSSTSPSQLIASSANIRATAPGERR
jgi:hypothetical protein